VHDAPVSHNKKSDAYLSLRIPSTLARDLKTIADREANRQSSVARRILTKAMSRELQTDDKDRD
jgi:hypothetical protein